MSKNHAITVFLLVAALFISSCAEDQDFDQIESVELRPSVQSSLFLIEAPESLVNASAGANVFTQTFEFDPFNDNVIGDRVIDGSITYEVENSTSKELQVIVDFLDASGTALDQETFTVSPSIPPQPFIERREVFYGPGGKDITILQNTTILSIVATNLGDNISTSSLTEPKIILRSSGNFRVRIR
ncbi:hypothetical protein [Spongiimicrobium salis]|uniref:hypothetical protein n=1 Tax=Spongiimicrobium salis TaxID=1667022 RepID=UPI00374D91AF